MFDKNSLDSDIKRRKEKKNKKSNTYIYAQLKEKSSLKWGLERTYFCVLAAAMAAAAVQSS